MGRAAGFILQPRGWSWQRGRSPCPSWRGSIASCGACLPLTAPDRREDTGGQPSLQHSGGEQRESKTEWRILDWNPKERAAVGYRARAERPRRFI